MLPKKAQKVAPVKKPKSKTRVSEFIESKKPNIYKCQQVQPRNVSKIPYILDVLKLSEAVKKLGAGSSKLRKEKIEKVRLYDPNITHGDVEAAFEGIKGAIRKQRHFDGINPNDLIEYYRKLDEHIRSVHDPLQGVYRNASMSDQSLGINARANELTNDIESHAIPQPPLRDTATASSKDVHKGKEKEKDNIYQQQDVDDIPDAFEYKLQNFTD
ncbi:MAG: hypothetical protein EZS28_023533 [Streblomastix strix]|uniref:Uncharacterized protein n=1 Tax=Streblomastix strix TaxID=222440 RepID=A0A5J4VEJ1_9EUKA|nr:MAG: hypothetical protein EZS28_023533 [Streblomastix strix]